MGVPRTGCAIKNASIGPGSDDQTIRDAIITILATNAINTSAMTRGHRMV